MAQTICIPYTSPWGELSVEVGLVESSDRVDSEIMTNAKERQLVGGALTVADARPPRPAGGGSVPCGAIQPI